MDEVNACAIYCVIYWGIYWGAEVGKSVELGFLAAPVVGMLPVMDKLLQIGQVGAIAPARTGQRIGPARHGEAGLQIIQDILGDVDGKGLGGHHFLHFVLPCHKAVLASSRTLICPADLEYNGESGHGWP